MGLNKHNEEEVLRFLDNLHAETEKRAEEEKLNNDINIKYRKLDKECEKGKTYCLDTLLGKIYKDALPFEDPQKKCSDDTAREIIHDFISSRTGDKGTEYYVREAIKRTNSPTLKTMMDGVDTIVKEFYAEKVKDIGTINIKDLDWKINDTKLDKLSKNMDLSEISKIIETNVQNTLKEESDRAKREEEYRQSIEAQLADDPDVTDDASMESALDKLGYYANEPKVYQPSLFEAIMVGKGQVKMESTNDELLTESIREFTKLNIIKALALESFNLEKIKDLANSYLHS